MEDPFVLEAAQQTARKALAESTAHGDAAIAALKVLREAIKGFLVIEKMPPTVAGKGVVADRKTAFILKAKAAIPWTAHEKAYAQAVLAELFG